MNEDKNLIITLSLFNRDTEESISLSKCYLPEDPWTKQAELFHRFLQSQGYVLDAEAVGVSLEDYQD